MLGDAEAEAVYDLRVIDENSYLERIRGWVNGYDDMEDD